MKPFVSKQLALIFFMAVLLNSFAFIDTASGMCKEECGNDRFKFYFFDYEDGPWHCLTCWMPCGKWHKFDVWYRDREIYEVGQIVKRCQKWCRCSNTEHWHKEGKSYEVVVESPVRRYLRTTVDTIRLPCGSTP